MHGYSRITATNPEPPLKQLEAAKPTDQGEGYYAVSSPIICGRCGITLPLAAAPYCVCRRATGDYRQADGTFVVYKGVLQGAAYIAVACTVMARVLGLVCSHGLYTYGLCSYGLSSYGLYSYGLRNLLRDLCP